MGCHPVQRKKIDPEIRQQAVRVRASCWLRGRERCAIKWTRLSCRSFAANAVRLQLHALAYNLGNFLRTLATPEAIKDWVAHEPAREAHQDRREGCQPRPLRRLSNGRGRHLAPPVRGDPSADRRATRAAGSGDRNMNAPAGRPGKIRGRFVSFWSDAESVARLAHGTANRPASPGYDSKGSAIWGIPA